MYQGLSRSELNKMVNLKGTKLKLKKKTRNNSIFGKFVRNYIECIFLIDEWNVFNDIPSHKM